MTRLETSPEPKPESTESQDVVAENRPKETLSPAGKRGVQGMESEPSQVSPVSSEGQPPTEAIPEKGRAPLSPDTKLELNRIQSLPPEERKEAWSKFFQSLQDSLGNSFPERDFLQLDTEVLRDGKGIKIRDENGTVYQVDYE